MKKTKTPWFRKPRVERVLAQAALTDAMGAVQPVAHVRIYSETASVAHLSASATVLAPLCRASAPAGKWYGPGSDAEGRWLASPRRECKLCAAMSESAVAS